MLADAIHADGNKFGIYVDQGYRTCQDRPGTLDNELKDATTFAEWGVDYVKNDACFPQTPNIKGGGLNQNVEGVGVLLYQRFFAALKATNRPMFFSVENPELVPPELARDVSNSRRVGGDIGDNFGSTVGEFHTAPNATAIRAGPGFYNDLDMLEIGNGHQNKTEYTTQFSLWCIAKANLLLGCDLSQPSVMNGTEADAFEIILNPEAIAISQDPLAMPATLVGHVASAASQTDAVEVWSGPLVGGAKVLLFLNAGNAVAEDVSFSLLELDFPSNVTGVNCRDLWLHAACTGGGHAGGLPIPLRSNITVTVAVHGVVLLRLTPSSAPPSVLAAAAVHEITAEEAVAAAEHAAREAAKFRPHLQTEAMGRNIRSSHLVGTHRLQPPPSSLPAGTADTASNSHRQPIPHGGSIELAPGSSVGWPMRGFDAAHTGPSKTSKIDLLTQIVLEDTDGDGSYVADLFILTHAQY